MRRRLSVAPLRRSRGSRVLDVLSTPVVGPSPAAGRILGDPDGRASAARRMHRAHVHHDASGVRGHPVVTLQFTRHLYTFFPQLGEREVQVEAATVAEALAALEQLAPGIGFYLRDELGRVRPHVNIFVGTERIRDRRALTDPLRPGDTVWILQALSGG